MYNTKNVVEEITLEKILERTTEYDIYNFYINHNIKVGHVMKSPLRIDNHPSFGIFKSYNGEGQLLYKDLSTNETGNVVKFVKNKFQLRTYKQALKKIWEDVVVNKHVGKSEKGELIQSSRFSSKKVIMIKRKYFTHTDDEYWEQYYIDRETLKKYNVFPIEAFWVNDVKSKFAYTKDNPMYAYKIFNSFKIYRPYSAIRADKWRTNCTKYDIQGWEQLPDSGELLIITKSLKDVMVLSRFNIASIAPHSEVSVVPIEVIEEAKKRFKRIVVLYDNDATGKQSSDILSSVYELDNVQIPTHYLDIYNAKDISDFVKEFGVKKTKELLKEIL